MNDLNMDMKGRVYWITGLSGSGKTTIGTALYYDLKKTRNNVLLLDGDLLKNFVNDSVGYSAQDRLRRGKQYAQICKLLAEQGLWVIICTIAMFDEIRIWNRENIRGYIEIFLDVPFDIIIKRDKKGLYSTHQVALYEKMQFPKQPDVVLKNDGTTPIRRFIEEIKEVIPQHEDDFARDQAYWNQYYLNCPQSILNASDFAKSVIVKMEPGQHLLDLGCGNGRDSLFFLQKGLFVTGVDASNTSVDRLNQQTYDDFRALFICDDFTKCRALFQKQYDFIYSRFTLHAITDKQETDLFENLHDALKVNGRFFIEARSIADDLYGLGEKVEEHSYIYDNHFRRFIDGRILVQKLKQMGYSVLKYEEGRGFSKTATSDPVLIRLEIALSS